MKNRSHTITAHLDIPASGATGVVVAQGGRFGGWSLYLHEGRPSYAYNYFGSHVHSIRAPEPLPEGRHEVRFAFDYEGGGVGHGGTGVLQVDGEKVATGTIGATIPYYFAFDETFDIGLDRATPVTDDYPIADNAFTGILHWVRFDLADDLCTDRASAEARERFKAAHD